MLALPKVMALRQRLQASVERHADFVLLLILFITFRVLALVAFRPGGLVLDHSDFYWYRNYAELTHQGYYPFESLWTPYPPLFIAVMVAIYQISSLVPPWDYTNLWFTLLLGGFFLLFEIGNFVLLYLFALKLYGGNKASRLNSRPENPIRPCWIYAALFVPVYTLTGWFESYPLFFFLLSLYLLLQKRPYLSAVFTGLGFMIKLIPLILIPVAIQLFSRAKYRLSITDQRLSFTPYQSPKRPETVSTRTQNPSPPATLLSLIIPFDLPRMALYFATFLAAVVIVAAPFYAMNPDLILSPQLISTARQPWQTVWALIDGNYDYGIIPLDVRDLAWNPDETAPTRIPWLWVTAIFGLIYAAFYTRPLNWTAPRKALAFVGFTLCIFMLWSKGYSPQWLGWSLFFNALLLPNMRGVVYATILNLANIIEANFYFIIFPDERWLLATTILVRTVVFFALAIEFLWLIWPQGVTPRVEQIRGWGVAAFVALLIVATIPAGLRLSRTYFEQRRLQSPYAATITRLQHEPVTGALLLNSHLVFDWFYPYLRDSYTLSMLDDYAPAGDSVEARTTRLLDDIATRTEVLWIYDADVSATTPSEEILNLWLDHRPPAHIQDIDGGRLYLFILN